MALPSLAEVSALEVRLGYEEGSLEDAELARAEAALADASALVRAEAGVSWVDPDSGALASVPDDVVAVTVRCAIRAFANPQGLRSESVGDYSYSVGEASAFLTADERRIVREAAARSGGLGRAYTVRSPSAYFDARMESGDSDLALWGLL